MSDEKFRNPKITSFTDIVVWQKSHALALRVYEFTEDFPKSERFGLFSQMRRAVISISSNIAEGFGRRTAADRLRFYDTSRASTNELQSQLLISRDLGFLSNERYTTLEESCVVVHKLLTGLINKTQEF